MFISMLRVVAAIAVVSASVTMSVGFAQQPRKGGPQEQPPSGAKAPSDKAPQGAPHEPTGWSGSQTDGHPKPDPAPAERSLEGPSSPDSSSPTADPSRKKPSPR
jgi:hypothetical protein